MNSGILWRSPSIDLDDVRLSRRRASNAEPHLNLAQATDSALGVDKFGSD
jgi:hypothetical protein